jgi:hypothetical protein
MNSSLCSICSQYVASDAPGGPCFWLWVRDGENIEASGIPVCKDNDQFSPEKGATLADVLAAVISQETTTC